MGIIAPVTAVLGVVFAVRTGRRIRRTGEMAAAPAPAPQARV
jgi:hypothetical protein